MGKKNLHFVHSGQSYGGSKFNVPKNGAKLPHFGADLELGSRFGPQHEQKRSKSPPKKIPTGCTLDLNLCRVALFARTLTAYNFG